MAEILLTITLNGELTSTYIEPGELLLDTLRSRFGLMGAKKGCGAGECGACTVIVDGDAVNSCIVPSASVENCCIETIEGLSRGGKLHPLQQAFIDEGAIQCGFCTPGMIMSAKALLDKVPQPTKEQIRNALAGNLCRCTGYISIENAVSKAAEVIYKMKKEGEE